ncbi:uncharacterized protein J7T54_002074 [Emericellopsis cladophorae]|uniref:Uncharacterized protein n=1 Tax=Emericellopsis cladophorae TaxID=2686198 RepID=A0A9Q0BFR3_9HYPO|nr:uncharacterized protein J7T54_002074 [Emericellopsis cladophorae]KAI6782915.1 hypothetical protein J7T54_002074 [Emericellopsis cladophorae]
MSLTVLTDRTVTRLLTSLTAPTLQPILASLGSALTTYALDGAEKAHQPHRAVVNRDGQVSLFMPSSTTSHIGTKMVGVTPADRQTSKTAAGLNSVLTLCDEAGRAVGVLNAAGLTAFRTALGIMLLYRFREVTDSIVVFGAGKQALWHILLALVLKGDAIREIIIVNRSRERAEHLLQSVKQSGASTDKIRIFDAEKESLEDVVTAADVLFCTTPSTAPLFPASWLLTEQARRKTRFISMIGSYRLDMQEIDPDYLRKVVDAGSELAQGVLGAQVAVDTRDGCLAEAGELAKAGIEGDKMREVGEILYTQEKGTEAELDTWLKGGLVVYKSVGIGIMDIAVGSSLLELAQKEGAGTTVEDF